MLAKEAVLGAQKSLSDKEKRINQLEDLLQAKQEKEISLKKELSNLRNEVDSSPFVPNRSKDL